MPSFEGNEGGGFVGKDVATPATGDGSAGNTGTDAGVSTGEGGGQGEVTTQEGPPVIFEEIIKNETVPRKKTGGADQFDKLETQESAQQDFYRSQPVNIRDFPTKWGPGKIGTLPDGRTIIYRPGSMEGYPTLEVQRITINGNVRYKKIRYVAR